MRFIATPVEALADRERIPADAFVLDFNETVPGQRRDDAMSGPVLRKLAERDCAARAFGQPAEDIPLFRRNQLVRFLATLCIRVCCSDGR